MRAFTAPVLGFPVTVVSEAPDVLALAEASFGAWRSLTSSPDLIERRGVQLSVAIDGALAAAPVPADVRYRRVDAGGGDGVGSRLELHGAACAGWADAILGRAELRVGFGLVAQAESFRYLVLEAAVLFLLTRPDRFPVHASAVARDGTAVLLAGPSASGKSTLAFAAHAEGWELASDDIVYVQPAPRWRVWGGAGARSYLAPDAARFFPQLAAVAPVELGPDRRKLAVTRPMPALPVYERAALCVLERGAGPARIAPLNAAHAHALLRASPEPGFDVFPDVAEAAIAPLVARAWRLTLGADPRDAVRLLEEVVRA